ncbi:hypothetical protein AXX12_05715 [Anaerosporomusa subterranea]|uniref:DUF3870 domain-containing protein n=1 Tax=Anaerosporomusa subterranea TaxID=1794912 RepID=A0A154BQZ4_ANASB|nr:DUF3870 domain-containing protein [Anaerosporomusa subterranea]KYZ75938.1 hypothetical protein AXX12_05715 [Anaerosporomusa subterranea]
MEYKKSTIFVTGVARPSKDDPVASQYDLFFLSLIVDKTNDMIISAACNTARPMTEDFICSLIVNRNIETDLESITSEIRARFFGLLQKALIVALKDAHNRYSIAKKL